MSTYHIGGLRLSTYRKDDVDMYIREKAIGGDMFMFHRHHTTFAKGIFVSNALYIKGKGEDKTIIHIEKGITGFMLQGGGSLHLSDLTIRVANQASAIFVDNTCNGEVVLTNVTIEYEKNYDKREKYALLCVDGIKSEAGYDFNHCRVTFDNVQLDSCFMVTSSLKVMDSVLSDSFDGLTSSVEARKLSINNTHLNNIRLVHTDTKPVTLDDISLNYGVSLHGNFVLNQPSIEHLDALDNASAARKIKKIVSNMNEDMFILKDQPYGNMPSNVVIVEPVFDEELFEESNAALPLAFIQLTGAEGDVKTEWVFKNAKLPIFPKNNYATNVDIILDNTKDKQNWSFGNITVQSVMSSTNLPLSNKKASGADNGVPTVDALTQLQSLTGLNNVKKAIQKTVALAEMNKVRREKNLAETRGVSLHSVFAGPAGTGKTTVARLYAQALFERGVIRKNTLIEATSKDLVSGFVGQTADKTHKIVMSALGGVLFIDEAYSLASQGNTTSFNEEAVAQLIADMENHRDDLVVILAGYSDEMKDFILNGNPGLQSRFTNWVTFDAYSEDELKAIFADLLKRENTNPADENALRQANDSLIRVFTTMSDADPASTGNGRFVRNFVQELMMAKDMRLSMSGNLNSLDEAELTSFLVDDVYEAERMLLERHHTLRG